MLCGSSVDEADQAYTGGYVVSRMGRSFVVYVISVTERGKAYGFYRRDEEQGIAGRAD